MTTDRELADKVEEWLHGRELQYATIKLMADVIYALRAARPPSGEMTLTSALRNCQGWADGIASTSKDNASREVASWIRDKCIAALSAAEAEGRKQ